MSDWGIALISASAVLAGSLVTGWFARGAGRRQADAARHAGDRQADALLATVRLTLQEQRAVRLLDLRRQTYVRFLEVCEALILARRTGERVDGGREDLQRALGAVLLEGPHEVARAAEELGGAVHGGRSPDELRSARDAFLAAARHALETPGTTAT